MDSMEKPDAQAKAIPVYRHSAEYAIQHGEIEVYRDSSKSTWIAGMPLKKLSGTTTATTVSTQKIFLSNLDRISGWSV